MLAYEIHVTGAQAAADAARVQGRLEQACEERVDPAVVIDDTHVLLVPSGVEWSFSRLRAVVASLRDVATSGSVVTFCGQPDDHDELVEALLRQARVLDAQGRTARARTMLREALPLATDPSRPRVERALAELGE